MGLSDGVWSCGRNVSRVPKKIQVLSIRRLMLFWVQLLDRPSQKLLKRPVFGMLARRNSYDFEVVIE